tara:strand:- start:2375 stop:2545 length:171 start_codon:yes stop_codon:yes gene_type:complete
LEKDIEKLVPIGAERFNFVENGSPFKRNNRTMLQQKIKVKISKLTQNYKFNLLVKT